MSRHLLLLGLYFVSSTLAFSQYEIDNREYNFSGNINVNNILFRHNISFILLLLKMKLRTEKKQTIVNLMKIKFGI